MIIAVMQKGEPMARLIDAYKLSRDMYHEAMEKDSDMQKWDSGCWIRYKLFETVLGKQPTADIQQWIPCSERLPEEGVRVLIIDRRGEIEFGHYEYGEWEWLYESGTNYWSELNPDVVKAWMPLPEPYNAERKDA